MSTSPYLIVSDLDATLLTEDKSITEKSRLAIQTLVRNGHYFIMNSGRPYQGLVRYVRELQLHQPVSVLNGAAIIWPDDTGAIKKAITFAISQHEFMELYRTVRPYLKACLASGLYHLHVFHRELLPFWILHENELVSTHEGEIDEILQSEVLSATFLFAQEDQAKILELLSHPSLAHLHIHDWGTYDEVWTLEISQKKATKGHALQYLADLWHIDPHQTIAYGDAPNDLSMIRDAYDGVVMANASQEIQAEGKRTTTLTSEEDGVIDDLFRHYPFLFD